MLNVYINGDHMLKAKAPKIKELPGAGTLMLARLKRGDDELGFSGFLTEFNIYSYEFTAIGVQLITTQLHCNIDKHGNWLSWDDVFQSAKIFGKSRRNSGADCTSFEGIGHR